MSRAERGRELVLALCHEVGNLLAAIRLQADAYGDEPGPGELARVAVEVDDLAGRCGALLGQVRALLGALEPTAPAAAAAIVAGVGDVVRAQGLRGVRFQAEAGEALPPVPVSPEWLHFVLLTLVYAGAEAARPAGAVCVSVRADSGEVVFGVEDDGPPDPELEARRDAALRGRALACALASHVLEACGGGLDTVRAGNRTRVEIRLPAAT